MTTNQILAKLRRKGGKTAQEIGTSTPRMRNLESRGLVVARPERRQTGSRGRPAVEWDIAETV